MTWGVENVSSHSNQQKRKPNTLRNSRKKNVSLKSQRPSKRHHVSLRRASRGALCKNAPSEIPHLPVMNWTLDGWCDEDDHSGCSSFVRDAWERKPIKNKLRLPSLQNDPRAAAVHLSYCLSTSSPQPVEVTEEKGVSIHTRIRLDRHNRFSDGSSVRSVLGINREQSSIECADSADSNSQGVTENLSGSPVCETGSIPSSNKQEAIVKEPCLPENPLPSCSTIGSISTRLEDKQLDEAVGTSSLPVAPTDDPDNVSLSNIELDVESLADTLRSLDCHHEIVDGPVDYHRASISTSSSAAAATSTNVSTTTASSVESCATTYGQSRFSRQRRRHRNRRVQMRIARRPRKLLVLGDMMSGKTNLISSYCFDRYQDQYIPTLLRCVDTDATVQGENIKLVVLDISGRDDFTPLRKVAYHKVDAVIFCYPVDSIESLERIRSFWVPELKEHAPKAPFVVVGTKRDVRDAARDSVEAYKQSLRGMEGESEARICAEAEFARTFVSYDRGQRLSNEVGAQGFYECSAMYRDGTRNLFEGVTMTALQKSRRKRKTTSKPLDTVCTIL